jgi:hypothetical protein
MTTRPRPLLAVRLIGPADIVAIQKDQLIAHFVTTFGPGAVCRASMRRADRVGDRRVYLTVTAKEVPPR